mmetsp:Transcript_71247/g.189448  ORF Transcript_71247/g.189448 Transcript_71247/m.189448 type:complete len:1232 (-) Transcript_71247:256-3951(-)
MKAFLLLLDALLPLPWAAGSDLKLGFLFAQSSESWLQESWSQFKLAIGDVNADGALLPNHTLTYTAVDTRDDAQIALSGVRDLVPTGVVGIIGTGYSSILAPIALHCSISAVPLVSSSSTAPEFIGKASYPFLFRTQPTDESELKAMAVIVRELIWAVVVIVANVDLRPSVGEVLIPALERGGISFSPVYYQSPDTLVKQQRLAESLKSVRLKGFRIVVLHAKAMDMASMKEAAEQTALIGRLYTWVMTGSAYVSPWVGNTSSDVVVAQRIDTDTGGLRSAFAARWPSVSTPYGTAVDGPFDATAKLHFYNASDPTIWDTSSGGLTGDGAPEPLAMSSYDAVFVLAKALHMAIASGGDPTNGTLVKSALLATDHPGISGTVRFSPLTQDREVMVQVVLTPRGGTPHVVGQTTPHFAALPTTDLGWCARACLNASRAHLDALPWSAGQLPEDGTGFSLVYSSAFWRGTERVEGDLAGAFISLKDSFDELPCKLSCLTGSQVMCARCQRTIRSELFEIKAYSSQGQRLYNTTSRYFFYDPRSGSIILGYWGYEGAGPDDREIALHVFYEGQPVRDGIRYFIMKSFGCKLGMFGPTGYAPCSKCLPGTVAPQRGTVNCTMCSEGTFQITTGMSECLSCAAGRYAATEGLSECQSCPWGTYQPSESAGSCVPCPSPMTTLQVAAVNETACVCPARFFRPLGTIARGASSGPCEPCPTGMTCPAGSDARNFPGGGGTTGVYPQLLPSFWSTLSSPTSVFKCFHGTSHCPGGQPETCAQHLVGRICARCADGYYHNWGRSGGCFECPNVHLSRFIFPWLVVIGMTAIVGPLYFFCKDKEMQWNASRMAAGNIVGILLVYVQVAALAKTVNVALPLSEFEVMDLMVKPWAMLQKECAGFASFAGTTTAYLLTPALFVGILVFIALANKVLSMRLKRQLLDSNVLFDIVGVGISAFFTSICAISFDVFKCFEHPNGERSVMSAPQVLCGSDEWEQVTWLSVFAVAVYCGGFLALSTRGLFASRLSVWPQGFGQRWQFILAMFRPSCDWWFMVVLGKGVVLNLPQIVFDTGYDQLSFMQLIIMSYAAAAAVFKPWRHLWCNLADICVHLMLGHFCSSLYWFAETESGGDVWRWWILTYGLWIVFSAYVLLVFFCLLVPRVIAITKGGRRRLSVMAYKPSQMQIGYSVLASMSDDQLLDLLETMPPMDRRTLSKVSTILSEGLQVIGGAIDRATIASRDSY